MQSDLVTRTLRVADKRLCEQAAEITRLKAVIAAKDSAISKAADIFRDYAKLHFAKGTPEGDEKAVRNGALADEMNAALTTDATGTGGEG